MRTLTTGLLSAQKGYGVTGAVYDAIWKIVLSRSGQTTRGYDMNRVMNINHSEEEDSGIAEVLLDNSDGALTTLDFERYQGIIYYGYNTGVARSIWVKNTVYAVGDYVKPTTANGYQYRCTVAGTSHATTQPTWGTALGVTQTDGTVTWEMDGNVGDEYSPTAPLKVDGQELISAQTQLACRLYLIGIPNQMAQDKAKSTLDPLASSDTQVIKTLIDAIADCSMTDGTHTPWTGYTAVTITYETGYDDGIINAFKPADYFLVGINDTRDDKIQELLNYTGCKRRAEDDGAIHIFDPVTTGTTYDYEYRLAISTYHTFFSKNVRNRFVNPNQEVVSSNPDHIPSYTGSSTSATSYALAPKTHTTYGRLDSDAQAALIAAALIERNELNAERGSAIVPMNCGQEVFDYIKVTDSSQSDTRTGNVQYIQRRCAIATDTSDGAFEMTIRFGRINNQSIGSFGMGGSSSDQFPPYLSAIIDKIYADMAEYIQVLVDHHNTLETKIDSLSDYIQIQSVIPKLHVTQQLIIPVYPQE